MTRSRLQRTDRAIQPGRQLSAASGMDRVRNPLRCARTIEYAPLSGRSPRAHRMGMPLPLPTFTTDDLRAFPEDGQRYELLEGVLLVTPPPGSAHQAVLFQLGVEIGRYLAAAGLAYGVAPGAIEIPPRTLLEP